MSRHTLGRGRLGTIVVGYDRPMRHFFCQVKSSHHTIVTSFSTQNTGDIEAAIRRHKGVLPDGLIETLEKEANGEIDPNYQKDWRSDDDTVCLGTAKHDTH